MSDSAPKLPPLPDIDSDQPTTISTDHDVPVMQQAEATSRHVTSSPVVSPIPREKKRFNLTMFPQRIESASNVSLVFLMLAIIGFGMGVAAMILMLNT